MGKNPAFQFYPADWLNDIKLQSCTLEAQGLLINLMSLMHQSDQYGYLLINGVKPSNRGVSHLLRVHSNTYSSRLHELILHGVLHEDNNGIIYCKRMVKDEQIRNIRREAGKLGGSPLLKQQVNQASNQKSTPSSSSSSSSSSSVKKTKPPLSKINFGRFDQFWSVYPRKQKKEEARRAWIKINPDESLLQTIIKAVQTQKISEQWQKDNGQYIPMPATWLNGKRWEDETNVNQPQPYTPPTGPTIPPGEKIASPDRVKALVQKIVGKE